MAVIHELLLVLQPDVPGRPLRRVQPAALNPWVDCGPSSHDGRGCDSGQAALRATACLVSVTQLHPGAAAGTAFTAAGRAPRRLLLRPRAQISVRCIRDAECGCTGNAGFGAQ